MNDLNPQPEIPQPQDVLVLDNLEALRVYFDPMRMRILGQMTHQAASVHEIAESLKVPFTRLYYHIKLLEKHQIIRVVMTKSLPGAIEEKYYQVSAWQFIVDRRLLSPSQQQASALDLILQASMGDSMLDIQRSVRDGYLDLSQESPHEQALFLRRGVLQLDKEQALALHHEMRALFMRYKQLMPMGESHDYGIVAAIYPTALMANVPDTADEDQD